MTRAEIRAARPTTLQCAFCGAEFPRGSLSPAKRNFCKPECRAEWTEKNRKPRPGFTDEDAERIWRQKYAEQAKAYYSGFVYRSRQSTNYGGSETGMIRRSGNPCL